MEESIEILFQDENLVAVQKPAGVLIHRNRHARKAEALLQLVRNKVDHFVYPVHRLDRATSGAVLFGLNQKTANGLAAQFRERSVHKLYLALVRGYLPLHTRIDYPLHDGKDAAPQEAVTVVRRLATFEMPWPAGPHPTSRYSLVVAAPREGRYHQIRKHLHHISHPIIGDRQYGDREHNQLFRERIPAGRLMLHARGLRLRHPETGAALRLRAPFPDDWQSVMDQLAPFTTDMGNAEEPAD